MVGWRKEVGKLLGGYSINKKRWVTLGIVSAMWSKVMFSYCHCLSWALKSRNDLEVWNYGKVCSLGQPQVTEERAGEFELKQYVCEGLQGGRRSVGANDGRSGMPDVQSSNVQMEPQELLFRLLHSQLRSTYWGLRSANILIAANMCIFF